MVLFKKGIFLLGIHEPYSALKTFFYTVGRHPTTASGIKNPKSENEAKTETESIITKSSPE
jgi:hypothetical protein